ncbi:rhomboid family intramembrane serine protease [Adhaeribacter rhizoryzae]|uniref:Rhomboid family intramembrane serine protease n=2 Tax=Adhaeribacter rhizoryzae TaxID=2607907 RepID=A0A5M6D846_9BACT|nr:rhomboid family intramembrane serine protease [Adhaeribacter rhizoryzae]
MMNITPMVRNLLIINLVAFIAFSYFGSGNMFALYDFRSANFRPYQFLTHMFMHGGWGHLFSNMFSLFIFGPMLEYRWGPQRFLLFYLITGFGASVLFTAVRSYEFHQLEQDTVQYIADPTPINFRNYLEEHLTGRYNEQAVEQFRKNASDQSMVKATVQSVRNLYNDLINVPMLGASGAVFGILMAFGMLFPNTELMLLFFPFPIKAKYFVMLYGAYELYAGIQRNPGDNVAHYAHLGGMLFAFILLKVWEKDKNHFY